MPPKSNSSCSRCGSHIIDRDIICCCKKQCKKLYHLTCLNLKKVSAEVAKVWQCPACCCGGCGGHILDNDYICCSGSECKKLYHLPCVNLKSVMEIGKAWLCPECCCANKKGGDNSSTPVRFSQNVTIRKPRVAGPELSPLPIGDESALSNLTEEIKLLREEILAMKAGFQIVTQAVTRCESRIDQICSKMVAYEARLSLAEERVEEFSALKKVSEGFQAQIGTLSHTVSTYENRLVSIEKSQLKQAVQIPPPTSAMVQPAIAQKIMPAIAATSTHTVAGASSSDSACGDGNAGWHIVQYKKARKSEDLTNGTHSYESCGDGPVAGNSGGGGGDGGSGGGGGGGGGGGDSGNGDCGQGHGHGRGRARASHGSDNGGVRRGTAAPGATPLCAAERLSQLHLYYVQEGTTAEQVRSHLTSICSSDVCTVEVLKSRGNYSSFKLGVPSKCSELVLSPNNWAKDICIKPWRQNFRGGNGKGRVSGSSPV